MTKKSDAGNNVNGIVVYNDWKSTSKRNIQKGRFKDDSKNVCKE